MENTCYLLSKSAAGVTILSVDGNKSPAQRNSAIRLAIIYEYIYIYMLLAYVYIFTFCNSLSNLICFDYVSYKVKYVNIVQVVATIPFRSRLTLYVCVFILVYMCGCVCNVCRAY